MCFFFCLFIQVFFLNSIVNIFGEVRNLMMQQGGEKWAWLHANARFTARNTNTVPLLDGCARCYAKPSNKNPWGYNTNTLPYFLYNMVTR